MKSQSQSQSQSQLPLSKEQEEAFTEWYNDARNASVTIQVPRHYALRLWKAAISARNNEIMHGSIFIKD